MAEAIRRLALAMIAGLLVLAAPVSAEDAAARLVKVLLLPEVAEILRAEGLGYGADLDRDFLGASGSGHFSEQISQIYDTGAMVQVMRAELLKGMPPAAIAESLTFFDTPTGQQILQLELSGRKAMTDPSVEELAQDAYAEAARRKDQRAMQIDRFIEINDLTERNVAGALSSNFQFFLGLSEGGGQDMTEAEIIDEVWNQEEETRTETRQWLRAFLFMAYGPLSDDQMAAYLEYSETAAGQALNAALFAGFDEMYRTIYYALGLAVAQAMQSSEL